MEPTIARLTPDLQQFVESIGLYFEQYQLPRIGGRILGLLMLSDRPRSLEDMAETLLVSRASVSTNIRLIVMAGLAEQISIPGDRRDYYQYTQNAWEREFDVNIEGTKQLRRLAERGLSALPPGDSAVRAHLEETIEFCDFSLEEYADMLTRWRTHQTIRGRKTDAS